MLISTSGGTELLEKKRAAVEKISSAIIKEAKGQGFSNFLGEECEGHAYSVNGKISNSEVRNLHILFAV